MVEHTYISASGSVFGGFRFDRVLFGNYVFGGELVYSVDLVFGDVNVGRIFVFVGRNAIGFRVSEIAFFCIFLFLACGIVRDDLLIFWLRVCRFCIRFFLFIGGITVGGVVMVI